MDKAYLTAPALIVVNEVLKRLGMPSKYAILVNLAGGVLLNMWVFWSYAPEVVLFGFLLGASAGGLYDIKKLARGDGNGK